MLSTTPEILLLPVWPLPLSLATTHRISVDYSSSPYLDVSVPLVPFTWLWIHQVITDSSSAWFPNSEICGSKLICSSPQLIAACHVLRRLLMPRHSPCALLCLNFSLLLSVCLSFANNFLQWKSFFLITLQSGIFRFRLRNAIHWIARNILTRCSLYFKFALTHAPCCAFLFLGSPVLSNMRPNCSFPRFSERPSKLFC